MKTVSAPLQAHLDGPLTTLCSCWEITRKDGVVLRFTDHDVALTVGGQDYEAAVAYDRSAVENQVGASVDNLQVQFVTFESGAIRPDDVRAGLYDYAAVRLFVVNWQAPDDGAIALRQGFIGELTLTRTGVGKGELRGLTQVYARKFIEVYSPECRADFGDSRCRFDLASVTVAGVVTAVTDRRTFRATLSGIGSPPTPVGTGSPLQLHAGDYNGGGLRFTSGANVGRAYEVRDFLDGVGSPSVGDPSFSLYLTVPYEIQVGDAFAVYPGCDKQFLTCRDRYHNTANFRGEPFVPGTDTLLNVTMPGDR